MSRSAVSCEHFAIFAHFDDVSLPSIPSSSLLSMSLCRSLNGAPAWEPQNRAVRKTAASVSFASSKERPRQPRNPFRRSVMSSVACCVGSVEPIEEGSHLSRDPGGRRPLEMNAFVADGAGDDLHRRIPPGAHLDFPHAGAAGRTERSMPGDKPFPGQGLVVVS